MTITITITVMIPMTITVTMHDPDLRARDTTVKFALAGEQNVARLI